MADIIGNLVTLAPYLDKLLSYICKKREEYKKEREAAEKLFRQTLDEIYFNIDILKKINNDIVKTFAVNSPQMKRIINCLKTVKTQKCKEYAIKFSQLKKKDSRKFFDKISIALHKINAMREYSEKTTNELNAYKVFRPTARLNNICKTYTEIIKIIK